LYTATDKHLLGPLLADHVLVENGVDLSRHGELVLATVGAALLHFLADDVVAQVDALVADEYRRAGDQLAHLVLALAAERAVQELAVVFRPG
jgi:hypothetical protein